MVPMTRRQKKALLAAAPPPPVISPADRLSKLPEEILAQILSFLPAREAVQTCVLARTWRHVWKFTRRLLITGKSVKEVYECVDRLLHVRRDRLDVACLDESEIRFDAFEPYVPFGPDPKRKLYIEDMPTIISWIDSVLECQIQMLRINIDTGGDYEGYMQTRNTVPFLVSRHLTRLELTGIWLGRCINLDGCPALEVLEIKGCILLGVRKILSQSLKCVVIRSCDSNEDQKRIQICVPRLVSLWLDADDVRTPLLERMPKLVGAKLRINSYLDDCDCEDPMACYHVTRAGDISDYVSDSDEEEESSNDYAGQNTTKCVVLEALAQARDLVLIDDTRTYIFRRDLRWCPTFCNLKTLVLIEEYRREPAYCSVVECMAEHAPLLEKLTLVLKKVPRDGKYKVEIIGYPDTKVTSTKISQYLQLVKIICEGVNVIFVDVLNLLDMLNICFKTRVTKYLP